MNGLAEISARWIYWQECVRRLRMIPHSRECQWVTMKAQADLVMALALYWGGH